MFDFILKKNKKNALDSMHDKPSGVFNKLVFYSSLFAVLLAIIETGFDFKVWLHGVASTFYLIVLGLNFIELLSQYVQKGIRSKLVLTFDLSIALLVIALLVTHFFADNSSFLYKFLFEKSLIKIALLVSFIRKLLVMEFSFKIVVAHPAQLFILSFLLLILLGTFLLMMPNATYGHIAFVDALFTATSAVCITGLAVKDTGAFFTPLGQIIIMCLFQLGGLGILTFATYFSYFFRGRISYQTQLQLGHVTSANRMSDVLKTLKVIFAVTFAVESVAAIAIYISMLDVPMSIHRRIFFSVFHAISAFCNAGFSTMSNSLYELKVRFNYPLQIVVAVTFLFGGLGFAIVANVVEYLRHQLMRLLFPNRSRYGAKPWLLSINSRISLVTTVSLLVLAFVSVLVFEWQGTLNEHTSVIGKLVTGFFVAASPRSSGINVVDMAQLAPPTVMLTIALMWVGAAPNSTGGGIKTTTFAVAVLNIVSLARGYSRIEVFRREIADISVKRAFAIICLSVIIIAFGCTLIRWAEPNMSMTEVLFESVSAYTTTGLSLGITPHLSAFSKSVLIGLMFCGRVGALTILIALLNRPRHQSYRYPSEEIIIT